MTVAMTTIWRKGQREARSVTSPLRCPTITGSEKGNFGAISEYYYGVERRLEVGNSWHSSRQCYPLLAPQRRSDLRSKPSSILTGAKSRYHDLQMSCYCSCPVFESIEPQPQKIARCGPWEDPPWANQALTVCHASRIPPLETKIRSGCLGVLRHRDRGLAVVLCEFLRQEAGLSEEET